MSVREVLEVDITYETLYEAANEKERRNFGQRLAGAKHQNYRYNCIMNYFKTHWYWHDLRAEFQHSVRLKCRTSFNKKSKWTFRLKRSDYCILF